MALGFGFALGSFKFMDTLSVDISVYLIVIIANKFYEKPTFFWLTLKLI